MLTRRALHLSGSALVALALMGCAATTYIFEPGPGGAAHSGVHVGAGGLQKYVGETSPDALRKRCGDKGLKDISISYGLVAILVRQFVKTPIDAMDMEYRCGANSHHRNGKRQHATGMDDEQPTNAVL